jgi:NAD+ diphosphatase
MSAPSYVVVKRSDILAREGEESVRVRLDEKEIAALGLSSKNAHDIEGASAIVWPDDAKSDEPQPGERKPKTAPPGFSWKSLRALYGQIDEATFAACGRAVHVADWVTTSRFCGACGAATERVDGERGMRCTACKNVYYPRIAPAVIVLVRRGDEALLARGARFPLPFFSTLAGFSEIGESLEETLAREVREEVGIEIHRARYFGSQPWPFPHSLMIGFTAEWKSGELAPDPKEIAEAAWFKADALPMVPPPLSIARALIDAWVREVLGAPRDATT